MTMVKAAGAFYLETPSENYHCTSPGGSMTHEALVIGGQVALLAQAFKNG